jgi:hypothetical protein
MGTKHAENYCGVRKEATNCGTKLNIIARLENTNNTMNLSS